MLDPRLTTKRTRCNRGMVRKTGHSGGTKTLVVSSKVQDWKLSNAQPAPVIARHVTSHGVVAAGAFEMCAPASVAREVSQVL